MNFGILLAAAGTSPLDDVLNKSWALLLDRAPDVLLALAILVVGIWLVGHIKRLLFKLMNLRRVDITLAKFLSALCYWLLIIMVIVTALSQVMQVTSIIAVVGAGALAIGLALQSSLSNFAAGVMIILFRHFRVGDWVEIAGVAGIVEEISIFDTILITFDNRKIVVPNSKILGEPITNVLAKPTRRLDITFGISYESDIRKAKDIILAVVREDARTLPDPAPFVGVTNLGDSSVDLLLQAWASSTDFVKLRFHLLETVKLRFDEAGIVIPYPQRDVHLYQATPPTSR